MSVIINLYKYVYAYNCFCFNFISELTASFKSDLDNELAQMRKQLSDLNASLVEANEARSRIFFENEQLKSQMDEAAKRHTEVINIHERSSAELALEFEDYVAKSHATPAVSGPLPTEAAMSQSMPNVSVYFRTIISFTHIFLPYS